MKSKLTNNSERLTWQEIKEKYPHQWVGLVDIEWEDEANIKSAVVKYSESDYDELLLMKINKKEPNIDVSYTTPNELAEISSVFFS